MVQGADQRLIQGGDGVVQHGRGDIHKSVGGVVRHHLVRIRQADQVFAGLDQAFHRAVDRDGLINQGQRIPDGDLVGSGIGIRKPETVRILRAVRFAFHDQNARNIHVFADGQCQCVRIVPDRDIQRQETGGIVHPADSLHCFQVHGAESFVVIDPVIRKTGGVVDLLCIYFQRVPFHIESEKNADSQRHHDHHGDELGFVFPQRSEKLPE